MTYRDSSVEDWVLTMRASLPALWQQTSGATSRRQRMLWLIKGIFGDTAPTYRQYMALRQALMTMLVGEAKSTSLQYVRKPLAEAVRIRFHKLPEQDTPDAARKRRERARAAHQTGQGGQQDRELLPEACRLRDDVRTALADASPPTLQRILCDLFCRMGYAASPSACRIVDGRGDGGFDLIIPLDRLALSELHVQVKCWVDTVREGPVRDFYGALQAKRQRSGRQHAGVFVTKSTFSQGATGFAESVGLVLLGLAQLVELMSEYGLGVRIDGGALTIDHAYFARR